MSPPVGCSLNATTVQDAAVKIELCSIRVNLVTHSIIYIRRAQPDVYKQMNDQELRELTVDVFHKKLQSGEVTIEEIVTAYLNRIERYDDAGPELNTVLSINDEAIDRGRRLDIKFSREGLTGALMCVPVLLKDQAKTAGLRTTSGSEAFAEYVPGDNATIVDRLEDAGAIILAKTNLPDFAAGFVGYSSAGGQTLNPYDQTRDSGGSSAGTGAGVTANFGLVGIGEDTGGSIRVPA